MIARENNPARERRDAVGREPLVIFTRALEFRSLDYSYGKMGTTRSLANSKANVHGQIPYTYIDLKLRTYTEQLS